jgi:uncharacterized membrane protein
MATTMVFDGCSPVASGSAGLKTPFHSPNRPFRRIPLPAAPFLFDNPLIERPDGSGTMQITPVILIHVIAALGAVVIGGVMLTLKKGTPIHRLFGRVWVGLMLTTALVSFGIRSNGQFSWIHLLSVWIVFLLGMALYAVIVKRDIKTHRRWMAGGYTGLVVAGVFALLPHRRFGYLVWHTVGLI